MAGKKTSETFSAGGVGESKPFIAPAGAFEGGEIDWAACTVNGQPIPAHLHGLIPYTMTDQGRAEANDGKEPARVQVLRESHDFAVERYRDDLLSDMPFEEQHDPLRVGMQQNLPAGHRGLWMSEKKCDQEGMRRGVLDYRPVMVEKDGKLDRVRIGGMFLSSVPEERARAADLYYEHKAREQAAAASDRVREQSDQIMSEEKLRRMDRRKGGGLDFGGLAEEDGEMVVGEVTREFGA